MSELKATPGEWFVFSEPVTGGYRIQTKDVRGIASATQRDEHPLNGGGISWEEAEVNAHLIAASRKMYSILERLEKFCDDVSDEDTYLYSEAKKLSSEIDNLLTKARGEQQ